MLSDGGDSNSDADTSRAMAAASFDVVLCLEMKELMLMARLLCIFMMAVIVKVELGLLFR